MRVGIEASGHARWFERLLAELGYELWIGNPAEIRAAAPRKQKTDARDAEHLLHLLSSGQFDAADLGAHGGGARCAAVGAASASAGGDADAGEEPAAGGSAERRHGAQAGAVEPPGQQQLRALELPPWTERRRQDNLELLAELEQRTDPLDEAVEQEAAQRPEVMRLKTHPGVGPITALTFVLTIGDPARFGCGKQVASYLGLIPAENSSGGKQRLGHITKQGNALLRGLLVEAAHVAARREPELGRCYRRLAMRKNRSIAAVAVARKLAVRLWWMWIRGLNYGQFHESGSHAGSFVPWGGLHPRRSEWAPCLPRERGSLKN